MSKNPRIRLILTGASAAFAAPWVFTAEPRFDPALEASGAWCNPAGQQRLMATYVKVAQAKTEVGPFHNRIDSGRPLPDATDEVPLWNDLGDHHFRVTTNSARAQRYFDQGLILAYGFNHAEARRSFVRAQQLDPACAMCYWGEALVLGPNINAPMTADHVPAARAAVSRALELASKASRRERDLIEALGRRYLGAEGADRAALDVAYADAMTQVAARHPRDPEIAALTAEALMDLTPWDYWEAGGASPKGRTGETVAQLERALALDPKHPGAIHFYIHILEASGAVQRSIPHAERLARLAPGAGHLVHMPGHAFYRVGRYIDSLDVNKAAVAADERYLARSASDPIYRYAYYPHNVHFLMVSAQMAGDGATAVAAAGKLDALLSDDIVEKVAFVQPIKASPYFAHAQFSDADTILALPDPGDRFPYVKAMWHYARGIARASRGELDDAAGEAEAIRRIAGTADFSSLVAGGVPGPDVLELATHVLHARIAQKKNRHELAVTELEKAVAVEDRFAYMEPPFWYFPVRQALGAARLMNGDVAGAERDLLTSLARTPNNGWALYGLLELHQRRGDAAAMKTVQAKLDRAWVGERSTLTLERL